MTLAQLSAADWPTVSALLDEALALPQEERDTFVQSLKGERAQHRETLRALLAQAVGVETDEFLATLPRLTRVVERGPLTELAAGDSIGPYRLISELGTGGMGAVWLAERADGTLKRKVALKLPRLVWARGLAERMARERDILASLEHPHIARLYDAGVDQHGRPYLALEYVRGQPINVYAKNKALTVRQRVELLLQVCEAVAYAHSQLVIHRDLKPSNILVTDEGQVRLLDFGIAKLMEGDRATETQLTHLAGRALTLDYASPEQIKGEPIGTPSDVYSLGVVAYELLTGAKPYRLKRGSAAELEEAILQADIAPASSRAMDPTLRSALRGDIDAIVAVALAGEPGRRYASVASLTDDLRRHLQGRPIAARDAPWPERLLRLVRRRPTESAVAAGVPLALLGGLHAQAAVLVALAAGTGIALWQRRAALAGRDAAEHERRLAQAAAEAQRAAARDAERQAQRAHEVKAFVLSLFELADPERGAGIKTTAIELLTQAHRRIDRELRDQPDTAFELKVALATSLNSLGDRAAARELLAGLVGPGTTPLAPSPHVVQARIQYADVLSDVDEGERAQQQLRCAAREARAGRWPALRVDALRHLALQVGRAGGYEQSARLAEEAAQAAREDGVSEIARLRAWSMLAEARFAARQAGVCEAAEQAIRIGERLYADMPAAEPMLEARQVFASGQILEGRPREAIEQLKQLLAARSEVLGPRHLAHATTLNNLANAQISAGDIDGVFDTLARLEEVVQANEPGVTLTHAIVRFRHAVAHDAARCLHEAVAAYRAALAVAAQVKHADDGVTVAWRSGLAYALARRGREGDLAAADATAPSMDAHPPADAFDRTIRARHLAVIRSLQGRHEEALALARSGARAAESIVSPVARAISRAALGWVCVNAGLAQEALPELESAEQDIAARVLPTSTDLVDCRLARGRALLAIGRAAEARPLLEAVVAFWQQASADRAEEARAAAWLAAALFNLGAADAASPHATRALAQLGASERGDDRAVVRELHSMRSIEAGGARPPAKVALRGE